MFSIRNLTQSHDIDCISKLFGFHIHYFDRKHIHWLEDVSFPIDSECIGLHIYDWQLQKWSKTSNWFEQPNYLIEAKHQLEQATMLNLI